MTWTVEFRLLGNFQVVVAGESVVPIPKKVQEFILVLVGAGSRGVTRIQVAEALWPESTPERAQFYLRRSLTDLRKLLGKESRVLVAGSGILRLDLSAAFCDLVEFETLADSASVPKLRMAIELYRGPLLSGITSAWVEELRQIQKDRYVSALILVAESEARENRLEEAVRLLGQAVLNAPLDEALARSLMSVHAQNDDYPSVMRVMRRLRIGLRGQFGIDPSELTLSQFRTLMQRSKISEATKPTRQFETTSSNPLPKPPTPFWGREGECRQIKSLISDRRLITIAGLAGVGKTRLAIQAASELEANFESTIYLDLSVSTQTDLSLTIAEALGAIQNAATDLVDQIVERTRGKKILLVLDGVEKLVEPLGAHLGNLLARAPSIWILCPTRRVLECAFETVISLAPFETPDPRDELKKRLESSSVSFLLERSHQFAPRFKLTEENANDLCGICRRLDGLPLALELAAARFRSMAPSQILQSLDQRFDFLKGMVSQSGRAMTLEAAIEVSFSDLGSEEQRLLISLAIFPGSFTIEAAEHVCGSVDSFLGLISSLVDQSVLEYSPNHSYRLLESIRVFCENRSDPKGWGNRRSNHAAYYLELTRSSEFHPDQFERESPNFMMAIQTFLSSSEPRDQDRGIRLINRLFPYWTKNGHLPLGIATAQTALEASAGRTSSEIAECLIRTAGAAFILFNLSLARSLFSRAYEMCEILELDDWGAEALRGEGEVAVESGHGVEAEQLLDQALDIFRKIQDDVGAAKCLGSLGYVARRRLQLQRAVDLTVEAMALHTKNGDQEGRLWCAGSLAAAYIESGSPEKASGLLENTLREHRMTGNVPAQIWNLVFYGKSLSLMGRHEGAVVAIEEAISLQGEEIADLKSAWIAAEYGEILYRADRIGLARRMLLRALQLNRDHGTKRIEFDCLTILALLELQSADVTSARNYLQLAEKSMGSIEVDYAKSRLQIVKDKLGT